MQDHVPILRRLRWGHLGFANLRFDTGAQHRLDWKCEFGVRERGVKTTFDCDWVGNHIRPGSYRIRQVCQITLL